MDTSKCPRVYQNDDTEHGESVPYCTLATRSSLARKSVIDECQAEAVALANTLNAEEVNLGLARAQVRMIHDRLKSDPSMEQVPYGEQIVAGMMALGDLMVADPVDLYKNAAAVVEALNGAGWIVISTEGNTVVER